MNKDTYFLKDDFNLLQMMINDAKSQLDFYKPGKYWINKTKISIKHIKKYGLNDFRGSSNLIGQSYSDRIELDFRNRFDISIIGTVFKHFLKKVYPFNIAFDLQVRLTELYAKDMLRYKKENIINNSRTHQLLTKYIIPYSLLGGCLDYIEIEGEKISNHYLNLLEQLDQVSDRINFKDKRSYFEIGGGFGVNVHLILTNFKSVRKIIYLDIPPNLYTGTQYLKTFFGDAVKDYRQTRHLQEIAFKNDDELEIFAITPWQIENVRTDIDLFWNSHSFVEMPIKVIKNYANIIENMNNYKEPQL